VSIPGGGQKKGKSKKWKSYLQFPHYTTCLYLRSEVDVGYSCLVDKQPIGKLLFRQFCEATPQYYKCYRFLEKVEEYEMSDDDGESRRALAQAILNELLVSPASSEPTVSGIITIYPSPSLNAFSARTTISRAKTVGGSSWTTRSSRSACRLLVMRWKSWILRPTSSLWPISKNSTIIQGAIVINYMYATLSGKSRHICRLSPSRSSSTRCTFIGGVS